jgi:hypothetical protein
MYSIANTYYAVISFFVSIAAHAGLIACSFEHIAQLMNLQYTNVTNTTYTLLLMLQVMAALPFAALVAEPAVALAAVKLWLQASAATAATAAATTDSVAYAEQCAAVQVLAQQVLLALIQQCGTDMRRLAVRCLASALTTDNAEQCSDSSSDGGAVPLYGLVLPLSSAPSSSGGDSNQLLRELLLHCSEEPHCAVTRSSARAIVCSVCAAKTTSIASMQQQQQQQQWCDAAAVRMASYCATVLLHGDGVLLSVMIIVLVVLALMTAGEAMSPSPC